MQTQTPNPRIVEILDMNTATLLETLRAQCPRTAQTLSHAKDVSIWTLRAEAIRQLTAVPVSDVAAG